MLPMKTAQNIHLPESFEENSTQSKPIAIEVKRYQKSQGWATRYWAVYVDGELLAVVLYRKGAQAIAAKLLNGNRHA